MDEAIEDVLHREVEYPFTQFVVCVGFLLVLIIENIAALCKREDQPSQNEVVEQVAQQIASVHSSTRSMGKRQSCTVRVHTGCMCRGVANAHAPNTRSRCTRVPILMDFKTHFCIISLNIYGFIMISKWISQKGVRESQAVGDPPICVQQLFDSHS